jgi:hypothetical protein
LSKIKVGCNYTGGKSIKQAEKFLEHTMTYESLEQSTENNGLAIVSMVSGILGWALFIALLCVNLFLLPMLAVATIGLGLVLYICLLPATCLSPLAWLIGIITGHISLGQIRATNQAGKKMAKAGLIMGYIGLGFMLLSLCAIIILALTGVSIPVLDEILNQLGIY